MEKENKRTIVTLGILIIGAILIILSFLIVSGEVGNPGRCNIPSVTESIFTSSFIYFGLGLGLLIIGFAKLYAERTNRWLHEM